MTQANDMTRTIGLSTATGTRCAVHGWGYELTQAGTTTRFVLAPNATAALRQGPNLTNLLVFNPWHLVRIDTVPEEWDLAPSMDDGPISDDVWVSWNRPLRKRRFRRW